MADRIVRSKTKTVFYGTGNPAPDYDPGEARPGDNKWTSSVVALDAATGKLKWGFQEVPHDLWDYDSATGQFTIVERNGKRSLVHDKQGRLRLCLRSRDRRD